MYQYKSICNPIIELTTLLQSCGFTIEKQELKDWHFDEFEIVIVAHWDNDGCSIRENCH